uniref:Uncharacterized protein n=1 Tax=Romanomermis culicivorax TaxID=13658 RepID=A0A915L1B3_ROMCU
MLIVLLSISLLMASIKAQHPWDFGMNRDHVGRQIAMHLIGRAQAYDPYGPGKRSAPVVNWAPIQQPTIWVPLGGYPYYAAL